MAEEVTSTVKTTSNGKVEIALEAYTDLVKRAEEEKHYTVNRTVVEKTPETVALENKAWGVTCIGLGVALIVVGAIRLKTGIDQLKELA